MITVLIFLGILILFGIGFSFLFKLESQTNIDTYTYLCGFLMSFGLTLVILFVYILHTSQKTLETCQENSKPVIPKIVTVSDSSMKILKYGRYEISLKPSEDLFYVPESLLRIDTCSGKIQLNTLKKAS
jgi:hypothetical protein